MTFSKQSFTTLRLGAILVFSFSLSTLHATEPNDKTDSATVTVGGSKKQKLQANEAGQFPRVYVKGGGRIHVELFLADNDEGEEFVIQALDGGRIVESGAPAKIVRLDKGENKGRKSGGKLQFDFEVNQEAGTYRVIVRRGGEERLFNFWVGKPLPVAAALERKAK